MGPSTPPRVLIEGRGWRWRELPAVAAVPNVRADTMGSMELRSDRSFRFERPRSAMWDAFTQVDEYRAWWPWLASFDGESFDAGERWRCEVSPPLPYSLHFDVTLTEVVPRQIVRARIDGDIEGWAELSAADREAGCELRLRSALSPRNRVLRLVALGARPVARFGHDWVLDSGVRQFRRHLDGES